MATARQWIAGARPQTLPVAVASALAGTAVAIQFDSFVWWKALLCLVTSIALQVGANYANDHSDGVRGTDEVRVGPTRLVAAGLATPKQVLAAAVGALAVGAVAGLVLVATTAWWLLLVGVAAVAAAWLYTGGPRPYGYYGLGELMSFLFFGPVAASGTAFVQLEHLDADTVTPVIAVGVGVGILTASVMMANNLRDRPTDAEVGKRTLAVQVGDGAARWIYIAFLVVALVSLVVLAVTTSAWALVGLVFLLPAARSGAAVLSGVTGLGLIPVLKRTGIAELLWASGALVGLTIAAIA